jgi:molybdate transport system substrate-binding protein
LTVRRTGPTSARAATLVATLVATVVAIPVAGCAGIAGFGSTTPRSDMTVFAAASLRDAIGAAADEYELRGSVPVSVSTDSSATLRTQIEQGARADAFLSADTANPEALAAAGLVDGPLVPFAGNRLAIVVPADNPAGIATPFDLGRAGLTIVAAGPSVPITAYATALLENLAAMPGAPAGLLAAYEANVASREDNVRVALAKVELGEADAAIVYASDAAASSAVVSIDIPPEANVVATYAGAVPTTAANRSGGHGFLDFLVAPDGGAILARFGFEPPP